MVKFTERERIKIRCVFDFEDRIRTQKDLDELFNAIHPNRHSINQNMVSIIESKFREIGRAHDFRISIWQPLKCKKSQ